MKEDYQSISPVCKEFFITHNIILIFYIKEKQRIEII